VRKIISLVAVLLIMFTFSFLHSGAYSAANQNESELKFDSIVDYFDKKIDEAINDGTVPGVSLAIVKGNDIYTNGYGYADIKENILVTSDTSFKIASITKLFTAISVMQQVEEGILDLNNDIREYLKNFEYSKKYTVDMKNLLTHTSGFDESFISNQSIGYRSNQSLEHYIYNNQPEIIRQPGLFTQYSNYGFSLAGYIVENVSGVNFKNYISNNIFKPLGMINTSFNYEEIESNKIAKEYIFKKDTFSEVQPYSLDAYPAGAINSSANDMAKFISFLINNDGYVLKESFLEDMMTKQYSNHKDTAGIGYGFLENFKNGNRFIGHGGSLMGINTELLLDIENKLGIFIVANSDNSTSVTIELIESFIDYFYDYQQIVEKTQPIIDKDIAGKYYSNRFSRSTIEKIQLLLAPKIEIQIIDKSSIEMKGLGPTKRYQHIGKNVFIDISNGRKIAFEKRNKTFFMYPFLPEWTLTKATFLESSFFHITALILAFLLFSFNVITFFISKIKNRKISMIRVLIAAISFINLTFVTVFIYLLTNMTAISEIGFGVNNIIKALLFLPIVSIFLTIYLIIKILKRYKKKNIYTRNYIVYITNIVMIIFFFGILKYYNLIGFNY